MTTIKQIEELVQSLNIATGHELNPYSNGKANIGTYVLAGAYGGHKLEQMCPGGGTRDLLNTGFTNNRDLYRAIYCFLEGIYTTKEGK